MKDSQDLFAFVLMPFDKGFDDIYRLGIKETASHLGILAERVDEQLFTENILHRIYQQIESADFVIADMSGQNPNVFYEVGYAHAKGKHCILLTKNTLDIPFDLKHHRHIVYGSSITKLREDLEREISWTIDEIYSTRRSRIRTEVTVNSAGLSTTRYIATGTVDFKVDLYNDTSDTSPEVDTIYFYCGDGWMLTQNEKECPVTTSDISPFPARHLLTPPIRRLPGGSWAQLRFSARKALDYSFDGSGFADSYKIGGNALLRLVTSKGPLDFRFSIDVVIEDDIPF